MWAWFYFILLLGGDLGVFWACLFFFVLVIMPLLFIIWALTLAPKEPRRKRRR